MKIGVIDVGSNTIKLLVAEKAYSDIVPVIQKTCPVRLGEGTFQTGHIPPTLLESGAEAIAELHLISKKSGADETLVFATSAVRNAKNATAFVTAVQARCGITPVILSGEEEAEYIFRGVAGEPELRGKTLWVVDVGGGSVELITGKDQKILNKKSLEIGAVRMNTKFIPHFPAPPGAFAQISQFVKAQFASTLSDWDLSSCLSIATGGSVICMAQWHGDNLSKSLTKEAIHEIIKEITPLSLAELNNDPRIPRGRGEVLLSGAAIYYAALDFAQKDSFYVTRRNLRYGLAEAIFSGEFSSSLSMS